MKKSKHYLGTVAEHKKWKHTWKQQVSRRYLQNKLHRIWYKAKPASVLLCGNVSGGGSSTAGAWIHWNRSISESIEQALSTADDGAEIDRGFEGMRRRRNIVEAELHPEVAEPAAVWERSEAMAGERGERRADERWRREQGLRHWIRWSIEWRALPIRFSFSWERRQRERECLGGDKATFGSGRETGASVSYSSSSIILKIFMESNRTKLLQPITWRHAAKCRAILVINGSQCLVT